MVSPTKLQSETVLWSQRPAAVVRRPPLPRARAIRALDLLEREAPEAVERRETASKVIDDYGKWYVDYGKASKDTVNAKMARKLVNTNAIDWLTKYNRNPVPSTVVWNLGIGDSNDNFRYVKNLSAKSRNYWLDIGVDNYPTTSKTVVQSRLDKTKNKIQVLDAKKYLRILLRDGMLDLSKSISVEIGGQTLNINVGIAENATVINGTLVRNDPNLVFTADIILIQGAGGWTATTSQRPA